jgi:hypothetical protein
MGGTHWQLKVNDEDVPMPANMEKTFEGANTVG